MNTTRAQTLIVGCLSASAAVAAGSSLASGEGLPGMKMLVGVGVVGVGLSTTAMFAPDLAGGFAALVLVSTVFVYGGPAMDAVASITEGRPVRPRRSRRIAPIPPTNPRSINA